MWLGEQAQQIAPDPFLALGIMDLGSSVGWTGRALLGTLLEGP